MEANRKILMSNSAFTPTDTNKISPTVHKTAIEGLLYIPHKSFPDERGFYAELARIPELEAARGAEFIVKQVNQSRSITNIARGIHAESWNKLVTVTTGLCFCAIVDLRPDSTTFGQHQTFMLGLGKTALSGSIFIPSGLGNSFCVLEGPADYVYLVDALWSERNTSEDVAIHLFDPDINIQWPIPQADLILSKRDTESISLRNRFPKKF